MEDVKLSLIVQSNLSDALIEIANGAITSATDRIKYIRWLTFEYRHLNAHYDANDLYQEYLQFTLNGK